MPKGKPKVLIPGADALKLTEADLQRLVDAVKGKEPKEEGD